MKKLVFGLIAVAIVSVSCKKDEKATYIVDDKTSTNATTNATAGTENNPIPITGNPQQNQTIQLPTSEANPSTNKTVTAPGMNPPHGEPGHRCDIPVGAPLNSKPANNASPAPVSANAPTPAPAVAPVTQPQAVATGPKPATNPEHGQPHHRCDIPVGQPLP